MPKKYYGSKYEKEQKRIRDRQRDILRHLHEHGPTNWEHFMLCLIQITPAMLRRLCGACGSGNISKCRKTE